jgi:hypothetical protein
MANETHEMPFNFGDSPLIKQTEKNLEDGYEAIERKEQEKAAEPAEPNKGVQTYIPMSMYRRLNDIKLTRGETIANLVAEAVALWLDVQEGKL